VKGESENLGGRESTESNSNRTNRKTVVRKRRASCAAWLSPVRWIQVFQSAIMGNRNATWYFAGMAVPHYKKRQIESEPRHVEFTPTQAKENSGCPTTNL
jgi:hypothetical protein